MLTRPKLAHRIRGAVAEVDPDALASRAEQKTVERRVWMESLPDAMARLCVEGPAAQVRTLYEAIDAAARRETQNRTTAPSGGHLGAPADGHASSPGATHDPVTTPDAGTGQVPGSTQDPWTRPLASTFAERARRRAAAESDPARPVDTRRVGAKRFDALVAMATDVLADPDRLLGTLQGQRPHIQVTVAASTVGGADDRSGHLAGYGAIPARVARQIAALGEWRRLVTDPVSGALLDYGRSTYRPPAALRDFILARDATCIQPTCLKPSWRAQIDHLTAHGDGGSTSSDNTGPECERHHAVKTHRRGWSVQRLPDGSVAWTTPTGHVRIRPPDPIGPVQPPARAQRPAPPAGHGVDLHRRDEDCWYELNDREYAAMQRALDEAERPRSSSPVLSTASGAPPF